MKKSTLVIVMLSVFFMQYANATIIIMGGVFDCSCSGGDCTVLCGGTPNEACITILHSNGGGTTVKINGECSGMLAVNPGGNTVPGQAAEIARKTIHLIATTKNINGEIIGTKVKVIEQMPSFDDLKITPNPVQDKEIKFFLTSDIEQNILISVQDLETQAVVQKQIHVIPGRNTEQIKLDNTFRGVSILRVQTDSKIWEESILVQ